MIRQQFASPFANSFCPFENHISSAGIENICKPYCPFLHTIIRQKDHDIIKEAKIEPVDDDEIVVLKEILPQNASLRSQRSSASDVSITDSKPSPKTVTGTLTAADGVLQQNSNLEDTIIPINGQFSSDYIGYVATNRDCNAKPSPYDNYEIDDEGNNSREQSSFANASCKHLGTVQFAPVISIDGTDYEDQIQESLHHRALKTSGQTRKKTNVIPAYVPTPIVQLEREREARERHKEMVQRQKRIRNREIERQQQKKKSSRRDYNASDEKDQLLSTSCPIDQIMASQEELLGDSLEHKQQELIRREPGKGRKNERSKMFEEERKQKKHKQQENQLPKNSFEKAQTIFRDLAENENREEKEKAKQDEVQMENKAEKAKRKKIKCLERTEKIEDENMKKKQVNPILDTEKKPHRKRIIIEEDEEISQKSLSSSRGSIPCQGSIGGINTYVKCVAQLDRNIDDLQKEIRKSNNKLTRLAPSSSFSIIKRKVDEKQEANIVKPVKPVPIWRRPEKANSFDELMKEIHDNDLDRVCRKANERIMDTLFGKEDGEKIDVCEKPATKRRMTGFECYTDRRHKGKITRKDDKMREDLEDPWLRNEHQAILDLLSDSGDDDPEAKTPIQFASTSIASNQNKSVNKRATAKGSSPTHNISNVSIQKLTTTTQSGVQNTFPPTISSSSISLRSSPTPSLEAAITTMTDSKRTHEQHESKLLPTKQKTLPSTQKKGEQRKAHIPRPTIETTNTATRQLVPLDQRNSKVSLQIRQARLALIYEEYKKICPEDLNTAIESAQNEEKAVLDKCVGRIGYVAAIPNVIKRLRGFAASDRKQRKNSAVSHQNVLLGRHAESVTLGLHRAERVAQHKENYINEFNFYNNLAQEYLLTDEQLWNNGYPRWATTSTVGIDDASDEEVMFDTRSSAKEVIKQSKIVEIRQSELDASKSRAQQPFLPDTELKRVCTRCGTEYRLTKEGDYAPGVSSEECVYHWGRAWKKRIQGSVEPRYNCCDSSLDIRGCVVASHHVTQTLLSSTLAKYVETPEPYGIDDPRSKKVYALDCEMIYTVWGPEVARLSMVDILGELILDILIKPKNRLIDCNTKFSGLTTEQVLNAEYDLEKAHERFFELVNSETILIGHSLESDLRAMRIVHKRVVDTSVVFPHRLGPPQKRALKTLASEILQLIIQDDESGHDSKEDALACMQIMLRKIRANI